MQTVASQGVPATYHGRCTCGARSGWLAAKQPVEDWKFLHEQMIEKVRAHLGTRTPTLKQQRNYFESMALSPDASTKDRLLWQQLADEITIRLGDRPTVVWGQDALFSDENLTKE